MNIIIDAYNLLNRNFFIYKKQLAEGKDINFYEFILFSIKKYRYDTTDKVFVVWDERKSGTKSFRQLSMDGDYKANRNKDHYDEMKSFIPGLISLFDSLGYKNMWPYSLEADDVMAWLSLNLEGYTRIVTADSDLYQMVSVQTEVFVPTKQKSITVDNFEDEVGVKLEHYVMYKSIKGDTSDNIEGVPGYGEKKAAKLVVEFFNDMTKLSSFKHKDTIVKNLKLISLKHALATHQQDVDNYIEQISRAPMTDKKAFSTLAASYGMHRVKYSFDDLCYDAPKHDNVLSSLLLS